MNAFYYVAKFTLFNTQTITQFEKKLTLFTCNFNYAHRTKKRLQKIEDAFYLGLLNMLHPLHIPIQLLFHSLVLKNCRNDFL